MQTNGEKDKEKLSEEDIQVTNKHQRDTWSHYCSKKCKLKQPHILQPLIGRAQFAHIKYWQSHQ